MGELLANILTDYLDHVAKDCGYQKIISIKHIENEKSSNVYEVYYSEPNRASTVYFTSSYQDDELIKAVLIIVAVMKSFKEQNDKKGNKHDKIAEPGKIS